jgi:hypothetical protein
MQASGIRTLARIQPGMGGAGRTDNEGERERRQPLHREQRRARRARVRPREQRERRADEAHARHRAKRRVRRELPRAVRREAEEVACAGSDSAAESDAARAGGRAGEGLAVLEPLVRVDVARAEREDAAQHGEARIYCPRRHDGSEKSGSRRLLDWVSLPHPIFDHFDIVDPKMSYDTFFRIRERQNSTSCPYSRGRTGSLPSGAEASNDGNSLRGRSGPHMVRRPTSPPAHVSSTQNT